MEIKKMLFLLFPVFVNNACIFEKPPIITKQELLYTPINNNYSVSIKTDLKYSKKNEKYFIVLQSDTLSLIKNRIISNEEIEYITYLKDTNTYADSGLVNNIRNSLILDSKKKKVAKNSEYKFDLRSKIWQIKEDDNPYLRW